MLCWDLASHLWLSARTAFSVPVCVPSGPQGSGDWNNSMDPSYRTTVWLPLRWHAGSFAGNCDCPPTLWSCTVTDGWFLSLLHRTLQEQLLQKFLRIFHVLGKQPPAPPRESVYSEETFHGKSPERSHFSPSNALNWWYDLPEPLFSLLYNERLGFVTPEVFPRPGLLWEWLRLSQYGVCFTTTHHTCILLSLSCDFLEFFSLIWGNSTSLSHNDTVSCHLLSRNSTLCWLRLSANSQDYMFCLLWLFVDSGEKMQMLFNYSKGILINPLGRMLCTTCHGEASFIEQKV